MTYNIFQKMMYVILAITVACAVGVANYIYLPSESRIPDTKQTAAFLDRYYETNEKVLKELFPYEEPVITLEVPYNMSYTAAEFQQFNGTYLAKSEEKMPNSYMKNICFCGDSLSWHMTWAGNKPLENYDVVGMMGLSVGDFATWLDPENHYSSYNHSDDVSKTTMYWVKKLQPRIIYIMLGTNGVNYYDNETHIRLYKKLLDNIASVSPKSIIVICSVSPWNKLCGDSISTVTALNSKIDHFNMMLLELAKARGYYFLNVAEDLQSQKTSGNEIAGHLKYDYTIGDGYHWSDAARSAYINYVLTHPVPGFN